MSEDLLVHSLLYITAWCISYSQSHYIYLTSPSPRCPAMALRRSLPRMSIYAIGEGWTGALGITHLRANIPGHNDEDVDPQQEALLIYKGHVKQVSAGWGHTLLIDEKNQLQVVGRPHDFQTLLRLRRLPHFIRIRNSETLFQRREGLESWIIGKLVGDDGTVHHWDSAKKYSSVSEFTNIPLPDGATPVQVSACAGLSAVIGSNGRLYTFGLNSRGQCGTGEWSNNQWEPTMVVGLNTQGEPQLPPENAIAQVGLGLQFGVARNDKGRIFAWGKGNRGQLGIDVGEEESSEFGRWINRICKTQEQDEENMINIFQVKHIAAGMHHGAIVLDDNQVYVWGKYQSPRLKDSKESVQAYDANFPIPVIGLPELQVIDLSCGTHHTSVLLEDGSIWAFGLATDDMKPIHSPVQLCASGMLQMPLKHFESHFDRTTVVDSNHDVYQMNLWSNPELQHYAVFSPTWLDLFPDKKIQSVHRSWLHTLIVTTDDHT